MKAKHLKEADENMTQEMEEYKKQSEDKVNHPTHYSDGLYECIDVMQDVFGDEAVANFCLLNAFKYIWRCKKKGSYIDDIEKADWYLQMLAKLERGQGEKYAD